MVVPKKYRNKVLNGLHTDVGHPGRDRIMHHLRDSSGQVCPLMLKTSLVTVTGVTSGECYHHIPFGAGVHGFIVIGDIKRGLF